jgi:hypothetical protein
MTTSNLAIDLFPLATAPDRAPGAPRRSRPELVEVTPTKAQRRARPRIVAAAIAVGALAALLLAQLGLSMLLSQGAYTLSALNTEQAKLSQTQQALNEQLDVLKSPQNLARNAQALGMIQNTTPVYLDPKTGAVYGTPTPAKASDATSNTTNQVANSLLNGIGTVAKQGSTSTSKEQSTAAGQSSAAKSAHSAASTNGTSSSTSTTNAEKTSSASAPGGSTSKSSVPSNSDQLQAPTTR